MKTVLIQTLGCKVNQYESSTIADQFRNMGYHCVSEAEHPHVFVINTCTVTNSADSKSRNLIRRALRAKAEDPRIRIFVTGCYAQRSIDEIRTMGDIDLVIDNQVKLDISQWFETADYQWHDIMRTETFHYLPVSRMLDHTRAFQKIQDGCNFSCSYCAVPYARGKSRSCSFEDVISQTKLLVANGYKEIVLGGVNLGLYHDKGKDLGDVIIAIHEIPELKLIRLSSIEPQLINSKILDCLASLPKLCPHIHIPLQAGSDSVLMRMKRNYNTNLIKNLVRDIRSLRPGIAIGFDIICGFPAESDTEHREGLALLEDLEPTYLHVFTYSKRKGTPAALMKNQVHGSIAKTRADQLQGLNIQFQNRYKNMLIEHATPLKGIVEETHNGYATALSDHYIRIYIHDTAEINTEINITPKTIHGDGICGT